MENTLLHLETLVRLVNIVCVVVDHTVALLFYVKA